METMLPSPQIKQGSLGLKGAAVGVTVGVVALLSRMHAHKLLSAMKFCKTIQLEGFNWPVLPAAAASAQVTFPLGRSSRSLTEISPVTQTLHFSEVGAGLPVGKREIVGNAVMVGEYVVVGWNVVGCTVSLDVGPGTRVDGSATVGKAIPPDREGACERTGVMGAVGSRTEGTF